MTDDSARGALGRAVATRGRRILLVVTLAVGVLMAVAVVAGGGDQVSYAGVAGPVQSTMSVLVPLLGVVMARDLLGARDRRPGPVVLAAVAVAVAVGLVGSAVVALAVAVAPGDAADRWSRAVLIAVAGPLVQALAQLVGVAAGLLLRPAVVAALATIVVPLGGWFLLGLVPGLRPVRAFTPYAGAQQLLAGAVGPTFWPVWLATVLLWGIGPVAIGIARVRRGRPTVDGPGSR